MSKFIVINLEGLNMKAKLVDSGCAYTTYASFAEAAGYPKAAVRQWDDWVVEANKEDAIEANKGNIVKILAVGLHEITRSRIFVVEGFDGELALIGEKGLDFKFDGFGVVELQENGPLTFGKVYRKLTSLEERLSEVEHLLKKQDYDKAYNDLIS